MFILGKTPESAGSLRLHCCDQSSIANETAGAVRVRFPCTFMLGRYAVQGTVSCPSSAPGNEYQVVVHVGNTVLWASQRRLTLAAMFLQALRTAASMLSASGGTATMQQEVGL